MTLFSQPVALCLRTISDQRWHVLPVIAPSSRDTARAGVPASRLAGALFPDRDMLTALAGKRFPPPPRPSVTQL